MSIEVLKQALAALKEYGSHFPYCTQYPTYTRPELEPPCGCGFDMATATLRKAIEQAEKQEPVAQCTNSDSWNCKYCRKTKNCEALKDSRNFGTPPQREWVGLTEEEMFSMWLKASKATPKNPSWSRHIRFWKAIEAKLKEKNPHGWQSVANPTEWLDDLRGGKDEGKNKDLCDND